MEAGLVLIKLPSVLSSPGALTLISKVTDRANESMEQGVSCTIGFSRVESKACFTLLICLPQPHCLSPGTLHTCMSLRLSPNLVGEFSNPLVMSLTGLEEGDSGVNGTALLSRCALAGTENPHGIGNGVWGLPTAYVSRALSSPEQ